MVSAEVIAWGRERVRAGPWGGQAGVAYLAPLPGAPAPSAGFVRRCTEALGARGFAEVVTGALAPSQQHGFLAAGFEVREHLILLAHDLRNLPPASGTTCPSPLRPVRRRHREAVVTLDRQAFGPFWRLDHAGLDEALLATPVTRFRMAAAGRWARGASEGLLFGYAVSGRAGPHGYLQRLAVHPDHQRRGLGRALTLDALGWMQGRDVRRAVVNTQPDNHRALSLYVGLGFRPQPTGLDVLARRLAP